MFLFLVSGILSQEDISLKNNYFEYTWHRDDSNKLTLKQVKNLRTNTPLVVTPQSGTEEFVITLPGSKTYPTPLPKSTWTATANSEQSTVGNEGPAMNLLDNNPNTIWHSYYGGSETGHHDDRAKNTDPYIVTVDTKSTATKFKSIAYTQRSGNVNGNLHDFKLFVANTKEDLNSKITADTPDFKGTFVKNIDNTCIVNMTKELQGQFIAIVAMGENGFGSGAEFDLYSDFYPKLTTVIKASDLQLMKFKQEGDHKVTFYFNQYEVDGCKWDINLIYEMEESKHYLHKYMQIKASDPTAVIQYIDFIHFYVSEADRALSWGSPFVENTFKNLGQPIYINTFFAGCRFPCAHTRFEDNLARVRYYTGKQFNMFKLNSEGYYETWKTVFGAARESRIPVVRADFFSYISDIAVPAPFRKQYNSWYDWMLNIDEDNIMASFKEIEKGCTQHGIPPLDSYVIDDGWNNYNSDKYHVWQPSISGTTYNEDGFWTFNNKFPHKFTPPSEFSRKISSNFGVWLGPRGGYVTAGQFGKMIEDAGNGYYNKHNDDIDVGSHKYIQKLKEFLISLIRDYKVNYYKLDGFTDNPCTNASHDHMVGGPDNMYYFTDMWEKYIEAFTEMRKASVEVGLDDFWISATTWTSISPFHLQWSNSVWLQISGDAGYINIGNNGNYADQMLTYRDNCYYDYYDNRQLQFPANNIYNHDPIYGKTGSPLKGQMDDDYFRTFLTGCMLRGTAFVELYYSYTMMDEGEKWYVNGDVLSWAEKNHHILQHAQRFGGSPGQGQVYGYSSWDEWDGIIGIRNPGGQVAKFSITLDRAIGVTEGITATYRSTRMAHRTTNFEECENGKVYKYGDLLEVTLNPGEYRVYEFHKELDRTPPKVEVVKSVRETEIDVRFDEYVDISKSVFTINNGVKVVSTKLRADLRTVTLTVSPMKCATDHKLHIEGVADIFGNKLTTDVPFVYYQKGEMGVIRGKFTAQKQPITTGSVETDSFTIRLSVRDFKGVTNGVLVQDKSGKIKVELSNGLVEFTVDGVTVTSTNKISSSTKSITCVRERNGLIKIYIDQDISNSVYDKNHKLTYTLKDLVMGQANIEFRYVRVYTYGFGYHEVAEEIYFGNEHIERAFKVQLGQVQTSEILNNRDNSVFSPEEGSPEFVISFQAYPDDANELNANAYPTNTVVEPLDRSKWTITANSEEANKRGYEGCIYNLIDGIEGTIWHSKYDNRGEGGHDDRQHDTDPIQFTIDMGSVQTIGAFSYTPRQNGDNGIIKNYEFYAAKTKAELDSMVSTRRYIQKGTFKYLGHFPVYVNLTDLMEVRFVALLDVVSNSGEYASGEEFYLYPAKVPLPYIELKSTMFTLDHHVIESDCKSENLSLVFKPYKFAELDVNVTVNYTIPVGKHYMEKTIRVSLPKGTALKIAYIDLEHFGISKDMIEQSWTHPVRPQDADSGLTPFVINLGQPVYIASFFTGCRFPLSDNAIEDGVARLRYYSGKPFNTLSLDNDGYYTCWKTVLGAARSTRLEVVRNDFFSYIKDISVVTKLRKQYNSWYDWMLNINEDNIMASFKEIEKGCTQHGVPPLDSFVVDDGWNNYNSEKYHVHNVNWSGTTDNVNGFWEFNTKFPHGLAKPSDFAHRIGSGFGVWLGPRGGYSSPGAFGKMMEDAGNGYYNPNSQDVDVGSHKYIENLKNFLSSWIEAYRINYLKLDGFASADCPTATHDHMVGGPNGAYYYTDLWERYEKVFEELRKTAIDNAVYDLWISITCFVNPSPFHLQWANSVWFQVSGDVGYIDITGKDSLADQMLTYRDACYFNFSDYLGFQFPQRCLYNHDPIYGKQGTKLANSLDDDQFRLFLYFCAMRGNAFFEMYYTYTMLDEGEKWYVNGEVLKYLEGRFDVLQNSQRFGGDPRLGNVYGYSSWNETDGTIAIRNPSGTKKTFRVKLDRNIGVPESLKAVFTRTVLNFNTKQTLEENKEYHYGDEIEFELEPLEGRIIDFMAEKDTSAPAVEVAKAFNQTTILIRFNKRVLLDEKNYNMSNKKIEKVHLMADLRTINLTVEPLMNNTNYVIHLTGVSDQFGNKLNANTSVLFVAGSKIAHIEEIKSAKQNISETKFTTDAFTVKMNIKKITPYNGLILGDKDNSVFVESDDGRVVLTVGKVSVRSSEPLTDNTNVTLVREPNTMLKVYINGSISNSTYTPGQARLVTMNHIELSNCEYEFSSIYILNSAVDYNHTNNEIDDDNYIDVDDNKRKKIILVASITSIIVVAVIAVLAVFCCIQKKKKQDYLTLNSNPLITQN